MMLIFVIIGMMCNSAECYWAVSDKTIYRSYVDCKLAADKIKSNSLMYFKTDCMVKE